LALKTALIQVKTAGRDLGKHFLLTEMPAEQAEKWAIRALLLATNANVQIPAVQGMAAIALVGLQTLMQGVNFKDVEPLLDEMFQCVQIIPDMKHPDVVRPIFPGDIEEVATRMMLRDEVVKLHLGFSIADALSELTSTSTTSANQDNTKNTQTTLQSV
jgi:hypothetical protein